MFLRGGEDEDEEDDGDFALGGTVEGLTVGLVGSGEAFGAGGEVGYE